MFFTLRLLLTWVALAAAAATPARAATYYVSTASDASNGNTGTEASPWRTITYAATKAKAGDTVKIKAGNYGNEHVVVANSGTASGRITFEGYGGTPVLGTLPSPRTTPANTEIGFKMTRKNYITLRNLKFTWYYECVYVELSDYVNLENLVVDKCGGETYEGDGIVFTWSDYGTIKDCTVTDCGGNNVFLNYSNYCTIDGLRTLGTLAGTNTYATDYYCALRCSSNNVIKNSYAEDTVDSAKGNHGFIIKDLTYTPHSTGNVVQDCTAISFEECFSAAHKAYGNTFLRCTADNTGKGGWNSVFQARNGAHDNTFRECTGTGRHAVVSLSNYSEGTGNIVNKSGNKWINCTLRGIDQANSIGIVFGGSSNTVFENCVFDNVPNFARFVTTFSGITLSNTAITLKNCIINSIPKSYDTVVNTYYPMGGTPNNGTGAITATYNCFYDGFTAFSGTGNITANPKFASGTDYHLKSTAGRWTGSAWVQDTEDSPCIDTGDQASIFSNEPAPNGGRINIGRYGNTAEASKSTSGGGGGGGGGGGTAAPYDNWLREASPATVYPNNAYLGIGHLTSNNSKYRDLIWFDLSQHARPVKRATLSLYWYHPPTSTRTNDTVVDVYRPAMGWDHNGVCWTYKTSGVAWTNPGGDWYDKTGKAQGGTPYASVTFNKSQLPTNSFYTFDVTTLVNEYIASGKNAGFFIKARTESANYIAFYDLAATDSATLPKLDVVAASNAVPGGAWAVYE
ncbi:MAG: disaggregatase related repeat-containing protein [Candidatus Sumerlaeia bacterium]